MLRTRRRTRRSFD